MTGELNCFYSGAYPDFVTGSTSSALKGNIPVFMLHTAIADIFEPQLQHLSRNGYRTLDCDEFYAFLHGDVIITDPSVVLTFDDGEKSLFEVAFPLLKKYKMKAVNFLVTGRVHEKVDKSAATPTKDWLNWSQVIEMSRSGCVGFQSHTLWHEMMFTGDKPVDFMRPGLFTDGLLVDRPLVREGGREKLLDVLGAPVYAHAPRMTDQLKFHDREDIRKACIKHVEENGGLAFFARPSWKKELMMVWRRAKSSHPAGVFETPEEQYAAIKDSLFRSRKFLEEKIRAPVRHLAYPWATGGALAEKISAEAGYVTNFHGPLADTPINRPGQNPFRIARIKDDYIERLPGRGRVSLATIFARKLARRAGSADIY